jgi:aryl-alcohol dehydrogenase-like predicted oxidoreductase
MQYRQLGRSGVRVSAIGLGTNQFGGKVDAAGVRDILSTAIELGVNFIDTAEVYQEGRSEETIGAALQGRRDRMVLATKVGWKIGDGPNESGASRRRIFDAVEKSLRRLRTDYIDLYQIHLWDPATTIEETLCALDDLVRAGKVRYVGASNYSAWQLAESNVTAELRGWSAFVTIQPHYNMLEREVERELAPYCAARGIGILPYYPLAGGFLTGKYRAGQPPPAGSRGEKSPRVQSYMTEAGYARLEKLSAWAKARYRSMTELAHAWLLAQPQVSSVISGATRPDHVRDNVKGADWTLTPADLLELKALLES